MIEATILRRTRNIINPYLRVLRFESWKGWLFIFAVGGVLFAIPPIFPFIWLSISFASSTAAIFVLNQYFDRESDKCDDSKRDLPIASGEISGRTAIVIYIFLTTLSLFTVSVIDISSMPFFLAYVAVGICYSTPPLCLKRRPIVDVIIVGFASGVLPWIMGLQVSHQLTTFPWVRRGYQDAFFTAIPFFLFQCAGHMFHTAGDYNADSTGNICTFSVKYGKSMSTKLGITFLSSSAILPIIYGLLNLSSTASFLCWYLCFLVPCMPVIIFCINLLIDPSKDGIKTLSVVSRKIGAISLFLIWALIFLMRILLSALPCP